MKTSKILKAASAAALVAATLLLNSGPAAANFFIPGCPSGGHLGAAPGLFAFTYAQSVPADGLGNSFLGSDFACTQSTSGAAASSAATPLSQSSASASYGTLHLAGSGDVDDANPRATAIAEAGWTDMFVITGGTGAGSFQMTVQADGYFDGPGTSWLDYGFSTESYGMGTTINSHVYNGHTYAVLAHQSSSITNTVDFTYNVPFLLSGYAKLCGETIAVGACSTYPLGGGPFSIDFGHTANFFLSGLSQDDVLFTASGATYAEANVVADVPAPGTFMILLMGLGLLGASAARRRMQRVKASSAK